MCVVSTTSPRKTSEVAFPEGLKKTHCKGAYDKFLSHFHLQEAVIFSKSLFQVVKRNVKRDTIIDKISSNAVQAKINLGFYLKKKAGRSN